MVFDLGRVIVRYSKVYDILGQYLQIENEADAIRSALISYEYERGEIDRMEFLDQVKEKLNLDIATNELHPMVYSSFYHGVELIEETMEIVNEVKEKISCTALLSNVNEMVIDAISKKWPGVLYNFAYHFFSYKMGLLKPDPDIFRKMFEELNITPQNIIFIDDKKENVNAASNLYIRSILFINPDDLRKKLFQ